MPHLAEAHPSHGRHRNLCPCSLPTAGLAASKELHYARYDRSPTASDSWSLLCRHVPHLVASLLFLAIDGATPNPPPPPTLSSFPSNNVVGYQACCHMPCLSEVHLDVINPAMPSHAAMLALQRRHRPQHPSYFSYGIVTGYDTRCCASCLATVHLAVIVPLLSTCSFY